MPANAEFQAWLEGIKGRTWGVVSCAPVVESDDRAVLVTLYNTTNGRNWSRKDNWLSTKPIGEWYGVTTDATGRVTHLSLSDNNLTNQIPRELGNLNNLQGLDLSVNARLSGVIPESLGLLHELSYIYLNNCQFVGSIPASLGRLSNLETLRLQTNRLGGSIPASLGRLSNLEYLVLSQNRLTGSIPASLGRLANLENLVLHENRLTGSIPPELGQLRGLRRLTLSRNGLIEPLPESFLNLALVLFWIKSTGLCVPSSSAFRAWHGSIERTEGFDFCPDPERDPLIALYHSTNGPNWTNSTNWLSDAPLSEWHGVTTDPEGRVTQLNLDGNNLVGPISGQLGYLASLERLNLENNGGLSGVLPLSMFGLRPVGVALRGTDVCVVRPRNMTPAQFHYWVRLPLAYPCEASTPVHRALVELYVYTNGPDWTNNSNWLSAEPLNTWHGVSALSDGRVLRLDLQNNNLKGRIPPELGILEDLRALNLSLNELTGSIPPEIASLRYLHTVELSHNELAGSIPPEIASLSSLRTLNLSDNDLTGSVPAELGQLENLAYLSFSNNSLQGSIPSFELSLLKNLQILDLSYNDLTGTLSNSLAYLTNLRSLNLAHNRLSGSVPTTYGFYENLRSLNLSGNTDMSGELPFLLSGLNLSTLLLEDTQLCAPPDPAFQDWLLSIPTSRVTNCVSYAGQSAAYLTQAVQSFSYPVPLVAGEDAVLRVFVATQAGQEVPMPAAKAVFYLDGAEVHSVDVPGGVGSVPHQIDEGDLSASSNAPVPGSIVMPGLEMVVEIDPGGALNPALGLGGRLPPTGRTPVLVRDVPPFDLTLVPFLWREDPDRSILTRLEGLTAESDIFRLTRDLMPVRDFSVDVREAVWISFDPVSRSTEDLGNLLRVVKMVHATDGATGYYMGVPTDGGGGVATSPGYTSVSSLNWKIIAHELGHNFSLGHAPCGTSRTLDRNYPNPDGFIGAWGFDLLSGELVVPGTPDVMGYCGPGWISDYHFKKALGYRVSQAQSAHFAAAYATSERSLLLWGGVKDGELVLEPTFVVDAPSAFPQLDGPYQLIGEGRDGGRLFNLSFGMAEIADGEGAVFTFILPARSDWPGSLERITLSGPEGVATLGGEDELDTERSPAALLLDPVTGRVRGILRDWLPPNVSPATARRVVPEPGLEIVISRGIPSYGDWAR